LAFHNAKITKTTRTLGPERVQLEIEYLGSCETFVNNDSGSVKIAKLISESNCLPIDQVKSDIDNLQSDYFCSDVGRNRSIIHFVEVFNSLETESPLTAYTLSFLPTAPFRAHSNHGTLKFYRRPNCEIGREFCNASNTHVTSCTPNTITYNKKYIVNRDRIYIAVNQIFGNTCIVTGIACCQYIFQPVPILPSNVVQSICPNVQPTELNEFPRKYQKPKPKPQPKPQPKPENKYGDNDKHDNDRHDNDRHENKHDNEHHDNDRHDNDRHENKHDNEHHDNDRHDNDRHGNKHDNDRHGNKHHQDEEEEDDEHERHGNKHDNDRHDNDHHGNKHDNDKHDNDRHDKEHNENFHGNKHHEEFDLFKNSGDQDDKKRTESEKK